MSSEDGTVEASDQGPSPLPGSVGDLPVGSPASADRHPRGRPRKDVLASTPKPRKKVRNRGRAAADDDDDDDDDYDSRDGTEVTEFDGPPESGERRDPFGEGEDDGDSEGDLLAGDSGPLSPMFQHSLSLDSAGSSTLTAEEAKISEQLCAFCYCGERSLLGQGELKMFGPTPGYVPLHIRNRRGSSENDTDVDRSPERDMTDPELNGPLSPADGMADVFGEEPVRKLLGELGQIGLPDDINVQSLFDPTGQCCAHLRCAAWSEGVCRGEGQSLLYVDKAIDSGSTKHCAYCKRLGASIKCCAEKCVRSYHYPCAAATAGTFQNNRSRTLLCPEHLQSALCRYEGETNCVLCDSPGDLHDQLFCTSCGQHYHGLCLDVSVGPLKRAGWQCPECKVCQTCRNPGEDSKMLVCDMCDKGYHTFCLQPVMDTIPTNGWRCKNCRVCVQCGTRTSSQWYHNCLLCEACYQQHDPSAPCPICGKSLNPELHRDLLSCHTCKSWFHTDCERQTEANAETPLRDDYVCSSCKQAELDAAQPQSDPAQEAKPTPEPASEDLGGADDGEAPQGDRGFNTASASEERRDTPSALDPAQEIQVTVTVTERPTSPQLVPGLVEEVGQPAQGTPVGIVAETKESADIPLEAGSKPVAANPREVSSPTKESTEEPEAALEEPMEMSPSLEKGEEWSRTGLEEEDDKEEGVAQQVEGVQEEGELCLPVEVDTSTPVELDSIRSPSVEVDATPAIEVDATPAIEVDATPAIEVDATPAIEVDATPAIEVDATPAIEVDATPAIEVDATPAIEVDATPAIEIDTTPAIEVDTTPSLEVVTNPTPTVEVVTTPAPSVEVVTTPAPSVEVVTIPTPPVEVNTTPTPSVEVVTIPTPSVEVNTTPTPSVELVTNPTHSVEVVTNPTPSGEVVTIPTPSVEVVTTPTHSVEVVTNPTPSVSRWSPTPPPPW
ncbi:histone-lysine N-methyltransferase 2C-like [Conger conger]|uniref:histone-lysine N-methyltransferase 2C-like n=1 Tax=Conger conger TaxID=82655 RepID=UPI002A59A32A|nr:histone-lysine N-methyltransferase 2C-like [Conger conger]